MNYKTTKLIHELKEKDDTFWKLWRTIRKSSSISAQTVHSRESKFPDSTTQEANSITAETGSTASFACRNNDI